MVTRRRSRKREPSTSDDGSRPAVKRRAVAAQAEVKSPVKIQWKQVEHEVQEARRQLTQIRDKKCLQSVHTMEADTTKQRAEVKQEQQRLNLLTQQLTSSTQEASELEMKVELLKNQLAPMTSLSGKKETLNKQSELLNEEKQKLRNFRDVLKSGAFASVKAGTKSIVPLRKRTSSLEEIVHSCEGKRERRRQASVKPMSKWKSQQALQQLLFSHVYAHLLMLWQHLLSLLPLKEQPNLPSLAIKHQPNLSSLTHKQRHLLPRML